MADPREEVVENHQVLHNFALYVANQTISIIRCLVIEADNFEIKPATIQMVQQSQFAYLSYDDPNLHSQFP